MGSSLVIVAVPDENDRVWKVSSEKVPHLTLLFLGDDVTQVANLDKITEFVEHAVKTMLGRFYLTVDRRDEMGADKADVLVFKKGYDYRAVRDFRAALLQDANIKKAYDAAQQFDGPWEPHLTLGYPTAPAKEITDAFSSSIYSVEFTKIAIWTADYEGTEFLLKDLWEEFDLRESIPMDVAMSAIRHAGPTISDTPWSDFPDSDFDDDQWKRSCILDRGVDYNTAKQRYAIPVREPSGTLNRKAISRAAAILSSKGGFGNARGNKINATHDQLVTARNKLIAIYNSIDEAVPEGLGGDQVKQTVDLGVDFLAHFGVKGMHWGVRREASLRKQAQQHRDLASRTAGKGIGSLRGKASEGYSQQADKYEAQANAIKTRREAKVARQAPKTKVSQTQVNKREAKKEAKATKKLVKADKAWEKNIYSTKGAVAVHNAMAEHFNSRIGALNDRHDVTFTDAHWADTSRKSWSPAQHSYMKNVDNLTSEGYKAAVKTVHGSSPSGKFRAELQGQGEGMRIAVVPADKVKHAIDTEAAVAVCSCTLNSKGLIDDIEPLEVDTPADTLAQMADRGSALVGALLKGDDAALEHFGIKGMHWGQRKEAGPAVAPTATSTVPRGTNRKTKIETQGGENHPAHEDAIKVARAQAKLKKSGPAALSNKELQDMQTRLNLERNVEQLVSVKTRTQRGRLFVRKTTGFGKDVNEAAGTGQQTYRLAKAARNTARVAGAAAALA